MKEELLQKALQWAQNIENFVSSEAPLFVGELIAYYTAYHITTAVTMLIAVVLCTWLVYKGITDWEEMTGVVIGGVCGIMALVAFLQQTLQLIKITLAPRLYLIEKLSSLL